MKNLFIEKRITQNKDISDEAFVVWCGLRNIMQKDVKEYFVSFNMIAHSVFNRVPNRYELEAIKKGYKELVDKEHIKELVEYSKSEHVVDLSDLYYEKGQGYFADLSMEEMHKIMSIDCGRHSKYKLLRYFTAQVGSFNKSKEMSYWNGKIGGMSLDYFSELIPITKPTCISFNAILEENELLFVIRHKDFYSFVGHKGQELREIPNTYSRWEDQALAKHFAENTHGYKYFEDQANVKTSAANEKRSLAQKLNRFMNGTEYDIETIKKLYAYAEERNKKSKEYYETEKSKGFDPFVVFYDMEKFDGYLLEEKEWREEDE